MLFKWLQQDSNSQPLSSLNKHSTTWPNCRSCCKFISLHSQTVEIFCLNSAILIIRQHLFGEGWYQKNLFKFYFVAIFVFFFALSWYFSADAGFPCIRHCDTNYFNITKVVKSHVPLYYSYAIFYTKFIYILCKFCPIIRLCSFVK